MAGETWPTCAPVCAIIVSRCGPKKPRKIAEACHQSEDDCGGCNEGHRYGRHSRPISVARGVEYLDWQRFHRKADRHGSDDIFVARQHEGKGVCRDDVGRDERHDVGAKNHPVIRIHRGGCLRQRATDGGRAERKCHERRRDKDDRMDNITPSRRSHPAPYAVLQW